MSNETNRLEQPLVAKVGHESALEVIIGSNRSAWTKTYYVGTSWSTAINTYAEIAMSLLSGQEVKLMVDGKVHRAGSRRAA